MGDIAIRVEGISKRYRIGQRETYKTLRGAVAEVLSAPLSRMRAFAHGSASSGLASRLAPAEWIWALSDVSFEVRRGDVLGIIGQNGAGKSTLLKILSRITEPTAGCAEIHGRVGSLLEVGTGFNPELTGRENVYLNGAILGMTRSEIARKFDEIVAFAEVEKFIDTPVKRYSSGMQMRLAFAVAAHLEPEILIVDEVLAVGDAAFQRKCLGKIGHVAREGRTALFVSHNLLAVENLCDYAIRLHEGKIHDQGLPGAVISSYLQSAVPVVTERTWSAAPAGPEIGAVQVHRVRVRPAYGSASDPITVHTPLSLEFEYWNNDPAARVSVSFALYNEHDVLLFDICPPVIPDQHRGSSPVGLLQSVCHVPGDFLNDGLHRINFILLRDDVPVLEEPYALTFHVQDSTDERAGWYGEWPGAIRPKLDWETDIVLPQGEQAHVV